MLKRHNIVLNMVLLVLALCVVFFAYMPIHSYAEDESGYGTEVEWGYANADKGVKWTQYQDGDEYTLVLELTETGQASSDDSVKAIRRLLDKNASGFVRDTLGKNTTKIVIKEGITGIGWKTIRNDANEPKYGSGYNIDDSSNAETDVFFSFNKLKEVVPCSTIKRIGWSAFRKCDNLESFDFAACTDLEEIMNQAFNPSGLKEADLSGCKKLKTIRCSAFNGISNLKSVTLPENLENVGKTAFGGCSNLETLTIKENSEPKLIIWENAFSGIAIKSLTIPKSVIRLRRYAFEKCENLETATFADTSKTELWQFAFSGDTKLDEVIDEATKKLAFTKPVAKDMFTNYTVNINAFQNTALFDSRVDLEAEVDDKTSDYSGSPQNGYGLTDKEHVSVNGLHEEDELSGEGYTPSAGTYAGTYTNGSFDKDSFRVKRREYFTTDNYNVDDNTVDPGNLKINKVDLTITVKNQEYTYNGKEQGEDNTEYTDGSKVDAADLKGNDTVTGITLNGHKKDAGEYAGMIEAGGAAIGQDGAATNSYNISYVSGKLTIKPAPLEIRTGSASKTYDGSALKQDDAEIKGLQNGETADIKTTGSQTSVGSSSNSYTIEWKSAKEGNYVIVKEDLGTLTVTEAPVPANADDDDNGGGHGGGNGNGGGGNNAGGTAVPAAPAGTDIDDGPVPAADTPDTPDTPEEAEDIEDPDVPLVDNAGWALVNLLCMLATAALFVVMLVRSIRKRQEGESAGIIYVIAGLAVAVFAALIFFMTEDMKLPMIITDKWTLLMAVILAVQLAVAFLFRVRTADEDEEE